MKSLGPRLNHRLQPGEASKARKTLHDQTHSQRTRVQSHVSKHFLLPTGVILKWSETPADNTAWTRPEEHPSVLFYGAETAPGHLPWYSFQVGGRNFSVLFNLNSSRGASRPFEHIPFSNSLECSYLSSGYGTVSCCRVEVDSE